MHRRSFVRNGVAGGAAVAAMATLGWPLAGLAQETDASPATGSVTDFQPGVIDTLLGPVELPENPTRVICINDGPVDTMLNLGLTPLATGFSYGGQGIMEYLKPFTDGDIEYLGEWDALDLERIVELQPDLILAEGRGRFTGTTAEEAEADPTVQTIRAVAPLVIPNDIDTSDPFGLQYFEYSHLVWSHCLGKLEEGQAILDAQHEATATLKANLAEYEGQTSIVARPGPEYPLVMSQDWFTGMLLRRVGIVGNDYAESVEYPHSGDSLSMERIHELDADWIFLCPRFTSEEAAERDELVQSYFDNPLFASLPAISEGTYGIVDGQIWSGANSMIAADIVLEDIRRVILEGMQDLITS
jgi:iron complex transport system substrate-binding protein